MTVSGAWTARLTGPDTRFDQSFLSGVFAQTLTSPHFPGLLFGILPSPSFGYLDNQAHESEHPEKPLMGVPQPLGEGQGYVGLASTKTPGRDHQSSMMRRTGNKFPIPSHPSQPTAKGRHLRTTRRRESMRESDQERKGEPPLPRKAKRWGKSLTDIPAPFQEKRVVMWGLHQLKTPPECRDEVHLGRRRNWATITFSTPQPNWPERLHPLRRRSQEGPPPGAPHRGRGIQPPESCSRYRSPIPATLPSEFPSTAMTTSASPPPQTPTPSAAAHPAHQPWGSVLARASQDLAGRREKSPALFCFVALCAGARINMMGTRLNATA
ncbi:hypothetical protein EAI_02814 [Harpegnathos saltator]|uniref:Uncharacterized protein n=1 Tax=Harpegnathos saltator TaxID=610380 RepID=E2BUG8_HARSA|nr:hypothetical protein EAI_02814 [Harpegnathos saltator]